MISFGGAASCPLADRMLRDEGFVSWSHFELGGASARLTPGPMVLARRAVLWFIGCLATSLASTLDVSKGHTHLLCMTTGSVSRCCRTSWGRGEGRVGMKSSQLRITDLG